ncbi:uncharacterized protein LOC114530190 isoform X2 [Dendronephthya gigantea]|uniref:uncharacterized protein LOC114530190 isoform X2 n=1 Tax=Dendronephthya gigantea TaxID=151771 RepID=UPI001069D433|nr:uncharacterized protein LOC114530190 isoform X2 [Dendronephthya gigantea]
MDAFKSSFFAGAIFLCCCGVFQNGLAYGPIFGLCDVGDVITARNGSLVLSQGTDCTRIILAPLGWRVRFTIHEIALHDAETRIHDGGTRVGTLANNIGIGSSFSIALVFYTSSNALLVHTGRISSSVRNKFNATFKMYPHPKEKCTCPPTVNTQQTVCSFPFPDNSGKFYSNADDLRKECTTFCKSKHEIVEVKAKFLGLTSTSTSTLGMVCHLHLVKPTSSWSDNGKEQLQFNPNLVSCTKLIPATQILSTYSFIYVNITCDKLDVQSIEHAVHNFLVQNRSASYIGECYKDTTGNCTVTPVLALCSVDTKNTKNSLVVLEIRDNVNLGSNETATREQFGILYNSALLNLKAKVQRYVTEDLSVNNTKAINSELHNFYETSSTCPANLATTDHDINVSPKKSCIMCPLHTFKLYNSRLRDSICQQCQSNQRRLYNESSCVNGSQDYPEPSNLNCQHKCALGKFFNNDSGICDWCDFGYFQNSTTNLNPVCHRCPPGNTTSFVGARHITDCMQKCDKGQFAKHPLCLDCAIGYFMPYQGNRFHKCYKCPPGNTTLQVGTANENDCVDICTSGEYFNITQGVCVSCPNDTYQDEIKDSNMRSCKLCPPNSVTLSVGAKSLSDCLGPCSAGQYLDTTSRSCRPCPVNKYNDESNQTCFWCKQCPEHKITKHKGSTNISQCIYTCSKGEFFNITNTNCEMCPNNTYQDTEGQSSCKPCGGNTFTLKTGSKTCISPCSFGKFLNKVVELCQACPVGHFQNKSNYVATKCMPCPMDYYTGRLGSQNCTKCSNDGITIVTGATARSECIGRCEPGYFLNKTQRECQKCLKGFFQAQKKYRYESCIKCASANETTLESGAKSEEECVGYCASSPCLNGAGCLNIANDFNCTCPKYLTGKLCQDVVDSVNADKMDISMRFTNLIWNDNLSNPESKDFMEQTRQIESAVRGVLKSDATFRTVKVEKFSRGSVVSNLKINYVAGTVFTTPIDTLMKAAADGEIGNLTVDNSSLDIVNYTCGTPLGMENHRIPDSALSSANPDNYHPFTNARLNHNGPGWTPRVNRIEDAYLQVDFGEVVQLTGIATQGSSYSGGNWLKSYQFNYSIDSRQWAEYKGDTNNLAKVFGANSDVNTVVRNKLKYPVKTRYVRVIKYVTSRYLSFRCEFYGCPIPNDGILPTLVPPRTDVPTNKPSSTGNDQDDDNDDGDNTGLIVGLVLGISAVFIVIIIVVWQVKKNKRSHEFGRVEGVPMKETGS